MIGTYLVRHCGKEKSFREKSKALEYADALVRLGYDTTVWLVEHGVFSKTEVLIYASDFKQVDNAYAKFIEIMKKEVDANGILH